MVTDQSEKTAPQAGPEIQIQVRRWLEGLRDCSRRKNAMFTVSRTIELLYGNPTNEEFDTERGLIEYVLRFANGETDRSDSRTYLESSEVIRNAAGSSLNPMRAILAKGSDGWPTAKQIRDWKAIDAKQEIHERLYFRAFLSHLIEDRAKALERYLPKGSEFPDDIWMLPVLQRERHEAMLQGHVLITEPSSLETYISILLLDEKRGFGKDLRKCSLDGCEKFFLVYRPPTGRPQTRYCTREHMNEAHTRTATNRARKSRETKRGKDNK